MIIKLHDSCLQGNNKFVPMPPNIQTVNMLFGTEITKKEEMVAWLNKRRPSSGEINFHENSISKFSFRYKAKEWGGYGNIQSWKRPV